MKDSKSPGLDGLPKEFYLKFFPLIGNAFVEMINSCFNLGTLCPTQKRGVITLICKNKDKKEILNFWRPISLLNVDYKIVSKSITNRLSKVMSSIIGDHQTCAVPGRSIQDHLHLIRSIFSYVNAKDYRCGMVNLDQAKAFDRVSHHYYVSGFAQVWFRPGIPFLGQITLYRRFLVGFG